MHGITAALEDHGATVRDSVFLGVQNGNSVTVIDIVESRKGFEISSPIGTTLPLMASAIDEFSLSMMDPHDLSKYLHTGR